MKGIILSQEEVKAYQEKRKTVFVVPMKAHPAFDFSIVDVLEGNSRLILATDHLDKNAKVYEYNSPFGKTGDKFFVKEKFCYGIVQPHSDGGFFVSHSYTGTDRVLYSANFDKKKQDSSSAECFWKPSTNMRQDQARFFPTIKRQWVGKVYDTIPNQKLFQSWANCMGLGLSYSIRDKFRDYWQKRYPNHPFETSYSWFCEIENKGE